MYPAIRPGRIAKWCLALSLAGLTVSCSHPNRALGDSFNGDDLIISPNQSPAAVIVAPGAGRDERAAANDLAKYITMMCGAQVNVAQTDDAAAQILRQRSSGAVFLVGQAALNAKPQLQSMLDEVAKKDPVLRADAIALLRDGNRVYLAGTNDQSHYYAVSALLHQWGCRWYIATDFGECIPEVSQLSIGNLNRAYAPPFEARRFWISWNGTGTGVREFKLRNYLSNVVVPCGHTLAKFVTDLVPEGGSAQSIPVADPKTAAHVAPQVVDQYGRGEHVMMGMEDGTYTSDFPLDTELKANLYDKYFQTDILTDSFLIFYNNLAGHLEAAHPNSPAKIGFLSYINLTIPPQRDITAAKSLVVYLAPIDIDPIHGMDDPRSPPRQEYEKIMRRWSEVMEGRVVIYDYDQGMLIWRDLPNPSHMAFRQDVQHYRDAGVLGVDTESRHAIATTFTNLFFRAQLLWNPDVDVDALLDEFYDKFYGPAAGPMRQYWNAIYTAWENTIVQEHEYFAAPAIYTQQLIEQLRSHLARAESIVAPLQRMSADQLTRNQRLLLDRIKFTRLSFQIIDNYMAMVRATATDADYGAAVEYGDIALAAREAVTAMSGIFTTYRLPGQGGNKIAEDGAHWFFGETLQYAALAEFTNGTKGELVKKLPLEWSFRRDPHDTGLARHFAGHPADLSYWNAHKHEYKNPGDRRNYPTSEWEVVRTDLYPQSQGVLHPDWQSFTGFMWSKTQVDLTADQVQGNIHIRFPGLFGETWLYVNGFLVAHRPQKGMWWHNDYRFEWDADLTGVFKPGANDITIRTNCTHHVGGMFRRPFLYRAVPQPESTDAEQ
ncbi:MAG: hypothetical protein CMJ49_09165 [Planctomycetaceae bacterium]|nr:hypothetical protein [Planctomycetaceae bacterium]